MIIDIRPIKPITSSWSDNQRTCSFAIKYLSVVHLVQPDLAILFAAVDD
jgi:hypothetical protein